MTKFGKKIYHENSKDHRFRWNLKNRVHACVHANEFTIETDESWRRHWRRNSVIETIQPSGDKQVNTESLHYLCYDWNWGDLCACVYTKTRISACSFVFSVSLQFRISVSFLWARKWITVVAIWKPMSSYKCTVCTHHKRVLFECKCSQLKCAFSFYSRNGVISLKHIHKVLLFLHKLIFVIRCYSPFYDWLSFTVVHTYIKFTKNSDRWTRWWEERNRSNARKRRKRPW